MGMGPSRPSTTTPMFSTCPCTDMMMGTSSREVEHQMRYVECDTLYREGAGHLGARYHSYQESQAGAGPTSATEVAFHTCYSSAALLENASLDYTVHDLGQNFV